MHRVYGDLEMLKENPLEGDVNALGELNGKWFELCHRN